MSFFLYCWFYNIILQQEDHFRFVYETWCNDEGEQAFSLLSSLRVGQTWLLNKQTRLLHTRWEHQDLKLFYTQISIFARFAKMWKCNFFSLISGRLLWRNPIACTTLSESRRLESFADLQVHMECTRTFPALSASSKALCGPKSFSYVVIKCDDGRTYVVMGNKYRNRKFVRKQFLSDAQLKCSTLLSIPSARYVCWNCIWFTVCVAFWVLRPIEMFSNQRRILHIFIYICVEEL